LHDRQGHDEVRCMRPQSSKRSILMTGFFSLPVEADQTVIFRPDINALTSNRHAVKTGCAVERDRTEQFAISRGIILEQADLGVGDVCLDRHIKRITCFNYRGNHGFGSPFVGGRLDIPRGGTVVDQPVF